MKLVWRSAALADLRRLPRFLAPKNPRAARHAIEAVRSGVKILETFPNFGRPVPELDTEYRDWTVNFGAGAYVVRYRVGKAQVTILAVRHGREDDARARNNGVMLFRTPPLSLTSEALLKMAGPIGQHLDSPSHPVI